jgi:signal transduction histidine kinase
MRPKIVRSAVSIASLLSTFGPALAATRSETTLREDGLAATGLALVFAAVGAALATRATERGDATKRERGNPGPPMSAMTLWMWQWAPGDGHVTIFQSIRDGRVCDHGSVLVLRSRRALVERVQRTDARALVRAVRALRRGHDTRIHVEVRVRDHLGGWSRMLVRGRLVREGGKEIVAGILHSLGVSDETERRARHAQKLEAIGALAAGIAHEINSPSQYVSDNVRFLSDGFASIASYLDVVERALEEARAGHVPPATLDELARAREDADVDFLRSEIPSALEQSSEGMQRIAQMTRAMKELSHPGHAQRLPADVNRIIERTTTLARNEWKYVAELHLDLTSDVPLVPCFVDEIEQVILNLVTNAAHAVGDAGPERGRIVVSTRRCGRFVEICVEDDGIGIPEEIREQIFQPFFTTKEPGRGTGQGLAIVRSIVVHRHGGLLRVDTRPEHGSVFSIKLPLEVDEIATDQETP